MYLNQVKNNYYYNSISFKLDAKEGFFIICLSLTTSCEQTIAFIIIRNDEIVVTRPICAAPPIAFVHGIALTKSERAIPKCRSFSTERNKHFFFLLKEFPFKVNREKECILLISSAYFCPAHRRKTINEEVVRKICTEVVENKLASALSNWVDSSIPEPDETGCSESSISHDDMADFLRQKTQELKEAHLDQLVHEAVTVLENVGPKETKEILLHTPNPGFFETMTGLL